MNISILSLFPDLYKPFLQASLLARSQEKGLCSFQLHNLFDFAQAKTRVDAPTFGHNAGMLLKPEIMQKAFDHIDQGEKSYKIFLSPQGRKLDQQSLYALYQTLQEKKHVTFVASRYEGVDERVMQHYADDTISVGDFVVMGGDVPVMLLLEGLLRFVPGIVGRQESVQLDSFSGPFVDHPEYTKPVEWQGWVVPEVVRSGDHQAISDWRKEQAVHTTVHKHFAWLRQWKLHGQDKQLVQNTIPPHYTALLHHDMNLKHGVGSTSVTSLDVHDIARSSKTYGIKSYFVVTPIADQQKLIKTVLRFWQETTEAAKYNKKRHIALKSVVVKDYLADVVSHIEHVEGKKPLIIGTSALQQYTDRVISYDDQQKVWAQGRPVLFVFGTGYGMSDMLLEQCDYMLPPLSGFTDFNHLSVRSAAAIILDKWLGVNQKYKQI